jgi:multicomponent Na+:H+ antiporter subunit G
LVFILSEKAERQKNMSDIVAWTRFILTAASLISGVFILASAVRGVYKFDYVMNRMHAAAMGDTLGLMFSLIGLAISAPDGWVVAKLVLIVAFLWVASPVSSHLIARLEVTINPGWAFDMDTEKDSMEEDINDSH